MDEARKQKLIRHVERAASAAFNEGKDIGLYLNEEVVSDYNPADYVDRGEYDQGIIWVSVQDYRDLCEIFASGAIEHPVFIRMAARHLISTLRSQLKMGSKKATGVLSRVV